MKKDKISEYAVRCCTDEITDLHFACRMMITAALPHSGVKGCSYKRIGKNYTLAIANGYGDMIPYGSCPRVILSRIITEAVRTESREIYLGESLSDFMKQLGISPTGGETGSFNRFRRQFTGLMTSSVTYGFTDPKTEKTILINFHVADVVKFSSGNYEDFFGGKIILDEIFFNEIIKFPIPADRKAINVLMCSSLALDIYFWLTYRMSYLDKKTEISYDSLKAQFGFGYNDTKQGKYEFRRKFIAQLRFVLSVYTKARVSIRENGIILSPCSPHITKKTIPGLIST